MLSLGIQIQAVLYMDGLRRIRPYEGCYKENYSLCSRPHAETKRKNIRRNPKASTFHRLAGHFEHTFYLLQGKQTLCAIKRGGHVSKEMKKVQKPMKINCLNMEVQYVKVMRSSMLRPSIYTHNS